MRRMGTAQEEVGRIFARQRENRWKVAQTSARERVAKLSRLRDEIVKRREALGKAMQQDFHKNPQEVELTEIHPTLAELKHSIEHLADWMRPERVDTPVTLMGARSEIRREARGVTAILAPWNYPFFLLFGPLIGAVSAGCCAVLKPSEKTRHTALVMKEIIGASFPEDEVALLIGGHDLSDAMLDQPFDHFCFTGSTRIGRKIMEAAAKHLASVTLELGGKSPAVIDETADVAVAAERVAFGKFINAGQTCVAPDYVLVHASKERAFIEGVKGTVAKFYGATEEARKSSEDFARLIDAAAFKRVSALLQGAVAAGAKVECGGVTDEAERYVAPTVLSGVKRDSPIMQEEIFGPVLPVLTFQRRDEAVQQIRAGEKPLALYVFGDERAAEEVLRGTTAGGSCVNSAVLHLANPDLPFGGVGHSGMGSYHGVHGFKAFSHERAVLVQELGSPVKFLYPPYSGKLRSWAAAATRLLEK